MPPRAETFRDNGMLPSSPSEAELQWPPLSTRWCWRNAFIRDVQDLEHWVSLEGRHQLSPWDFQHCCPASPVQIHNRGISKNLQASAAWEDCWSLSLAFQSYPLTSQKNRGRKKSCDLKEKKPSKSYFMGCPVPAWGGGDWKDTCTWHREPSLPRVCWHEEGCTTHHVQNGAKFR